MALVHLILVIIVIPLICLFFILGITLLIVGIVTKRKPKYTGRHFPTVCIVSGASIFILPFLAITIIIGTRMISDSGLIKYDSVPEHWKNSWVNDSNAADEAIKALMESAGRGDREAFAKNFTDEQQKSSSFNKQLDKFFEAYPEALSECELDGGSSGGESSYNYGHNVKTASARYTCELKGEKYFINFSFCYENTDNPEKVGVQSFSVRNLGAMALYLELINSSDSEDSSVMVCDIQGSDAVDARLINELPFVWHSSNNQKLEEDEMRTLLSRAGSMDDVRNEIGEPNVYIKFWNSTGHDYYYELAPKNGEPQYAHITATSQSGRIIDAYVCTSEKEFYDNPLKEFQKIND